MTQTILIKQEFKKKILLKYSCFTMSYQGQMYSQVTQFHIYSFHMHILIRYSLSQDTEYSSLCYTRNLFIYLMYSGCIF